MKRFRISNEESKKNIEYNNSILKYDLKKCSKCGNTKPTNDFNKDKSRTDGLQHICRVCQTTQQRSRKSQICKKCRTIKPFSNFRKGKAPSGKKYICFNCETNNSINNNDSDNLKLRIDELEKENHKLFKLKKLDSMAHDIIMDIQKITNLCYECGIDDNNYIKLIILNLPKKINEEL